MDLDDQWFKIMGKSVEDASSILEGKYRIRVIQVDGVPQVSTCDYRIDRLNVAIRDGRICAISGLG